MAAYTYETLGTNPYENLARERVFLEKISANQIILYLWQNRHTVVIGKNQNAWRECKVELLQRDNGKLARRSSGGGTVYHDAGNLNFSFIMDRNLYDLPKQMGVVLDAVRALGVDAELQGRNDLAIRGQKFSGNAFKFTNNGALHHGTLLVNSDLDMMAQYLQVSEAKMQSKGIESVPARVCNLCDYATVRIPQLKQALKDAFEAAYGRATALEEPDETHVAEMTRWYSSWQWNFGQTPPFDISIENRFAWGEVTMQLALNQGRINSATVYSDAMDEQFIRELAPGLIGCPFSGNDMADAIRVLPVAEETQRCADELATWLSTLEL